MGEIVNLNRTRKARARTEAATAAAANRAKHGRTPAERERDAREGARRRALLDGAKLAENGAAPADGGGDTR